MDTAQARWRFETVSDEYGVRVSLVSPADIASGLRYATPASAIIGTDWPAERIAATLAALEETFEAIPEPEPEPTPEPEPEPTPPEEPPAE